MRRLWRKSTFLTTCQALSKARHPLNRRNVQNVLVTAHHAVVQCRIDWGPQPVVQPGEDVPDRDVVTALRQCALEGRLRGRDGDLQRHQQFPEDEDERVERAPAVLWGRAHGGQQLL